VVMDDGLLCLFFQGCLMVGFLGWDYGYAQFK
jgi:hypothetical protein